MRAVELIEKKRDGGELTAAEIEYFVRGYTAGDIPDYQAAALCMAIYFRGMTLRETADLTLAMARSGAMLDLHDVTPFIVDKHSSGGVGDKTTLVVGPIVAACGLPMGKLSGRGLAFSGGTLDKLESIPGFQTSLTVEHFKRQLREVGLVIAGQTAELAPADGKLYALRDVTGTVPAIPLIAASILSKKIAAGADAIVLDVKVGSGAFVKTLPEARRLAQLMVEIGTWLGRRMTALLSDMSQPLGRAVGNALEVIEAIETLRGGGPMDFREHALAVAAEVLATRREITGEPETERVQAEEALSSGAAWEKFRQFVAAQGGDVAVVDEPDRLSQARLRMPLLAPKAGYVQAIDAAAVGMAVVDLGGGRAKKGDPIDHAVGVIMRARVGDWIEAGQPLCEIHANDPERLMEAQARLTRAFVLGPEPTTPPPLIHGVVRARPREEVILPTVSPSDIP
ncbi:MAG: thymidine phosphorylase [Anaerolineae bacterium]|nr:thymidine phosphorylase [Anaerolineae bacterium]MDW8098256.1 thymidine phosphorylase [Anaerolineae bacterium]